MGFWFNGSKNGKGGRPAAMAINLDLPDLKQPRNESSQRVTCIFRINYKNEAIPPMFVVSSGAEGTGMSMLSLLILKID